MGSASASVLDSMQRRRGQQRNLDRGCKVMQDHYGGQLVDLCSQPQVDRLLPQPDFAT